MQTVAWNYWIKMAVILSKLILASSKIHRQVFIMSTASMQGFKNIHWKLCEEFIARIL